MAEPILSIAGAVFLVLTAVCVVVLIFGHYHPAAKAKNLEKEVREERESNLLAVGFFCLVIGLALIVIGRVLR